MRSGLGSSMGLVSVFLPVSFSYVTGLHLIPQQYSGIYWFHLIHAYFIHCGGVFSRLRR